MPKDSKGVSSKRLLDKHHEGHIRSGVEAACDGEFATDAEVEEFFRRYGNALSNEADY